MSAFKVSPTHLLTWTVIWQGRYAACSTNLVQHWRFGILPAVRHSSADQSYAAASALASCLFINGYLVGIATSARNPNLNRGLGSNGLHLINSCPGRAYWLKSFGGQPTCRQLTDQNTLIIFVFPRRKHSLRPVRFFERASFAVELIVSPSDDNATS